MFSISKELVMGSIGVGVGVTALAKSIKDGKKVKSELTAHTAYLSSLRLDVDNMSVELNKLSETMKSINDFDLDEIVEKINKEAKEKIIDDVKDDLISAAKTEATEILSTKAGDIIKTKKASMLQSIELEIGDKFRKSRANAEIKFDEFIDESIEEAKHEMIDNASECGKAFISICEETSDKFVDLFNKKLQMAMMETAKDLKLNNDSDFTEEKNVTVVEPSNDEEDEIENVDDVVEVTAEDIKSSVPPTVEEDNEEAATIKEEDPVNEDTNIGFKDNMIKDQKYISHLKALHDPAKVNLDTEDAQWLWDSFLFGLEVELKREVLKRKSELSKMITTHPEFTGRNSLSAANISTLEDYGLLTNRVTKTNNLHKILRLSTNIFLVLTVSEGEDHNDVYTYHYIIMKDNKWNFMNMEEFKKYVDSTMK